MHNAASLEYILGWQQALELSHAQNSHLTLGRNIDMT